MINLSILYKKYAYQSQQFFSNFLFSNREWYNYIVENKKGILVVEGGDHIKGL